MKNFSNHSLHKLKVHLNNGSIALLFYCLPRNEEFSYRGYKIR